MNDDIKILVEEIKKYIDTKQTETLIRFDKMDGKFVKIDQRFDGIDKKFAGIGGRFDKMENKIQAVFEQVVANTEDLTIIKSGLSEIKQQLDQKTSYGEFSILEQRVGDLEMKAPKTN